MIKPVMSTDLRGNVTVQKHENQSYAVGRAIKGRGYDLATDDGMLVQEPFSGEAVGILRPIAQSDKPNALQRLLGIEKIHRREFLGVLRFNDHEAGSPANTWRLDVYGRKVMLEMVELARTLPHEGDVTLNVYLGMESTAREAHVSDYY